MEHANYLRSILGKIYYKIVNVIKYFVGDYVKVNQELADHLGISTNWMLQPQTQSHPCQAQRTALLLKLTELMQT